MSYTDKIQLIDRATVCRTLKISNSTLWRMEKASRFIPKIYLSERRIAYKLSDLQDWIEKQKL